jgi:hypothetical protein
MRQVQLLLKDMESRQDSLELARDEFNTLEKASKYNKYLLRMRIWLREAKFAWRGDQLRFLRAAAGFYADYGAILKLMRFDQLRGKFTEPATTENTTGV